MFPIPDNDDLIEKPERFQHEERIVKTLTHVGRKCKSLQHVKFDKDNETLAETLERLENELRKAGG